jgi:hypothetical protein
MLVMLQWYGGDVLVGQPAGRVSLDAQFKLAAECSASLWGAWGWTSYAAICLGKEQEPGRGRGCSAKWLL